MVASTPLPALSTHTAYLALSQVLLFSLTVHVQPTGRQGDGKTYFVWPTWLSYIMPVSMELQNRGYCSACITKGYKKKCLLHLNLLSNLLSHWRGGSWTKTKLQNKHNEECCHIPGLCHLQLLKHLRLLKKDYTRYKKFSTHWRWSLLSFL